MQTSQRSLFSAALCFALCSGFASARAADSHEGSIARGQEIAKANCLRCHAIDQTSASTHKSAPEFRNIVKRYSPWTLAEALAEGIVTGHPDMPEFKFEPPDISALLTFMDTLIEDTNNEQ